MMIPNVRARLNGRKLLTGGGGGDANRTNFPHEPKTQSRGHFFSSRAKSTYLQVTGNLSRAIFFRPRDIHGPRAPIWEALH